MKQDVTDFFADFDLHGLAAVAVLWGGRVLMAVIFFAAGWWFARRASSGAQRLLIRSGADPLLGSFLHNAVFVLILALVVVGALDRIGVPTASLLAALGAAGLAIGLALQGSLANIAAGVLLMIFRPFRVGHRIKAAGVDGVVQTVGLMYTVLHSADHCELTVPNGKILGDAITNFTALDKRRLDLVVGIGYSDDIDAAIGVVREALSSEPRVMADPAPTVAVLDLGESSVDLAIRPWVAPDDYLQVRFALLREIKLRFDAAGISMPFPQREVTLRGAVDWRRRSDGDA
jgi:small conductance mechanosensitive channel